MKNLLLDLICQLTALILNQVKDVHLERATDKLFPMLDIEEHSELAK